VPTIAGARAYPHRDDELTRILRAARSGTMTSANENWPGRREASEPILCAVETFVPSKGIEPFASPVLDCRARGRRLPMESTYASRAGT